MDELDLKLEPTGGPPSPGEAAELLDLPIETGSGPARVPPPVEASVAESGGGAACLTMRAKAFLADAAVVLLLVAAALLAATAAAGEPPALPALGWAALFALYLSFFATVVPLVLFGRTVGMALTGLSARAAGEPPLALWESARRWAGTLLTAGALGVPLLWTRRRREAPSPADRLSGRPLSEEKA